MPTPHKMCPSKCTCPADAKRRATTGPKSYKEGGAGLRLKKSEMIEVKEEPHVATEANAIEETAGAKAGARRRLVDFAVYDAEGSVVGLERAMLLPAPCTLSGGWHSERYCTVSVACSFRSGVQMQICVHGPLTSTGEQPGNPKHTRKVVACALHTVILSQDSCPPVSRSHPMILCPSNHHPGSFHVLLAH